MDASPFTRGTETVITLKGESKRTRRLQEDEAERMLPQCGAHLPAVVEAAVETCMRRCEILGVRWADVQRPRTRSGSRRPPPKRGPARPSPSRPVCGPSSTFAGSTPSAGEHPPTAHVFGNEIGQRVGSIKTAWNAACKRASIVNLHFHDLRREAGSRWLEGGVPLQTVRDWLGLTSVGQTSTYLASTLQTQHEAMRRFDERRGLGRHRDKDDQQDATAATGAEQRGAGPSDETTTEL